MMEYTTNTTPKEIADRIRAARRTAIITHSKPDGDAIGSTLALKRMLDGLSKQSDILLVGPIETALLEIIKPTPFLLCDEEQQPDEDYDLVVSLDTGSWSQLETIEHWLRPQHEHTIVIDHHARGDDIAALRLVDTKCAAATQVLFPVLEKLGGPITGEQGGIAEALFVGIATDTGWFRFQNADTDAFQFAARLLALDVDKARLFETIEATARPQRLRVLSSALNSIEYLADGAIALMSITADDFMATGAEPEDLTGLVNEPLCIGAVRVSILLTEREPGVTKMSFRAKPKTPGAVFVNVNTLAQNFGGGGHIHAAGARVKKTMEAVRVDLLSLVETESFQLI